MREILERGFSETYLVFDGLSAKIAEHVGCPSLLISGSALAATLGFPDAGVVTFSEVLDAVTRIAQAVAIPVLCDADTGYGNVLNVQRTVREFERAGAAGIQLEDQVFPKKSHLGPVIPLEEGVAKIRAACEARNDPDFVIIGRTDALPTEGWDEVVRRATAYREAGADLTMVPAISAAEIPNYSERLAKQGFVCTLGTPDPITPEEAESLGFRLKLNGSAIFGAYDGMFQALREAHLGEAGSKAPVPGLQELMGMPAAEALVDRLSEPRTTTGIPADA
jgi:2-methylisocitrate lyase-like PEP mutase family enzyme